MSGGEAFLIMAATDMAVRDRRASRGRPAKSQLSRSRRLVTSSWTEILVAAGASIIIALIISVGGVAADRAASAATESGSTESVPDPLTLCTTVTEQIRCVREPT